MLPSERRDFIYRYVHEHQTVSISDLVELMNVSHMTVRRDIRMLEEEGKVLSISGGVKLNDVLRKSYLGVKRRGCIIAISVKLVSLPAH